MTIIEATGAALKSAEAGIHRRQDLRAEPIGASAELRHELSDRPTGDQRPAGNGSAAAAVSGHNYFGPERRIAQRRQARRNVMLDTRTRDRRAGADVERPALA
ncbi:hypothetical protein [Propionivibrio dicarboxylicus]|uniref:Uncharacterized protein n=1 Tax=Propionivibrio dicarboxylicus TaxID=83767 RepID=A0A1G8M7U2_9RHOO|nr:hypothetical protein [Propionivibrio dicarboxylicus]SDI64049.1 hypothetical protein SAMN05660652_03787 [Propionivibrio dicarboxylicus]